MGIGSGVRGALLTSLASIALIAAAPALAIPPDATVEGKDIYASGRLLVKGKPGLKENKLAAILAKHAAKSDRKIGAGDHGDVHVIKVPRGLEKKILAELSADPTIDFVELDRAIPAGLTPNDPGFASQWFHPKIGTPTAWDSVSGNGVVVAVLDCGVDPAHPDLAPSMLSGWNSVSANTDSADICGHGTKVAGTIGAIYNNSLGGAGVASGAKILPVRITNDATGYAYWSNVTSAVTWAANNGAKIVNNSYASYTSSSVSSAAAYLKSKGGMMFSSAGNDNLACSVAADPNIMVISATTSSDTKASWSNYGNCIDVSAPGAGIYTTVKGGGYGSVSGTSFASPISAAVAALIFNANPALSPNDVEAIMKTTAVDLEGTDFSQNFGYGRINAAAAVAKAKTYVPTVTDVTAPTATITSPAAGATIKGLVPVDVTAGDNVGVTKVELLVNGVLYATDTAAPYSFAWDTAAIGNASANLSAIAYDAAGNKTPSTIVKVNVGNVYDFSSPKVTITSPAEGATVSGNVAIKAKATDDMSVASMSVSIDGKQVATAAGASISYTWNTRKVAAGSHVILVTATDSSSNTGQLAITVKK